MCCIAFCLYWLQDLASECPVDLYADSVRTCRGCNFRGKLQKLQYCYHRVILSQYSWWNNFFLFFILVILSLIFFSSLDDSFLCNVFSKKAGKLAFISCRKRNHLRVQMLIKVVSEAFSCKIIWINCHCIILTVGGLAAFSGISGSVIFEGQDRSVPRFHERLLVLIFSLMHWY